MDEIPEARLAEIDQEYEYVFLLFDHRGRFVRRCESYKEAHSLLEYSEAFFIDVINGYPSQEHSLLYHAPPLTQTGYDLSREHGGRRMKCIRDYEEEQEEKKKAKVNASA